MGSKYTKNAFAAGAKPSLREERKRKGKARNENGGRERNEERVEKPQNFCLRP